MEQNNNQHNILPIRQPNYFIKKNTVKTGPRLAYSARNDNAPAA